MLSSLRVKFRFWPIYVLISTLFIGGVKSVEASQSIDADKLYRAALLLLAISMAFLMSFDKARRRLVSKEILPLYIYFFVCIGSAFYSDSFLYPFSKSVELFASILCVSLVVSKSDSIGKIIENSQQVVFLVSFFILISSLAINISLYGSPFGYYKTSTSLGASALICLLSRNTYSNRANVALKPFLICCLLFSFSRTNLGLALFIIPLHMVLTGKVAGSLAILIVAIFGPMMIYFFTDYLIRGEDWELIFTLTGRLVHWEHAWSLFVAAPFFGYGYYYGVRVVGSETYTAREGFEFSTFDNSYLDSLVSVGVVGSTPLFYMIIMVVIKGYQSISLLKKNNMTSDLVSISSLYCVFLVCILRGFMAPAFVFFHWNQIVFFTSAVAILILHVKFKSHFSQR